MMPLGYAPHPSMPAMMPGMGWAVRPFSHEEHTSFLDAMERYGQDSTGEEWEKITQAVGNGRSIEEVRMHAHEYFVSLQMVIQGEPDGHVLGNKIKKEDWTFEQDMVFEHAMAEFEETDPLRWMKVASLLPGKNHEDVRHRYQRLVYDVHKIEISIPMEVKYKAPKAGKSLLAKVAPAAKPRNLIFKSRGVPLAPREDTGASKKPKPLGSKARMALLRLEELEKEAVKPSKPFKTKIKGKGGGYILSTKSSPKVPKAVGTKVQRERAESSSNSKSGPRRAPPASNADSGPRRASSASNADSKPQRASSASESRTPTSSSKSGGKGKGKAKAAVPPPVPPRMGSHKGGSSGKGPKGVTKGKEVASGGSSKTSLKRSAVTHCTNLKRLKVVEKSLLRKPLDHRGPAPEALGKGVPTSLKGVKIQGGRKGTVGHRKSERTRTRRVPDGKADEMDDEETDDEVQGSPQGRYNLRR